MKADKINKVIAEVKEQTGIELVSSKKNNKRSFFYVDIPTMVSEWSEYDKLERYASQYKTIRIEPNGVNKIAIYPL